ncbi:unnamed protein product [Schistosoma mattheei]|uniref:Uncharacterized protein n=1 Tax=Schistosoma mattheei TaxID=31246 RepID=A0A183P107_9TREM|nr:unnamed protein product [Schistosoma mattheei]
MKNTTTKRELIQKSKSSVQEIKTLCVNYGGGNELDSQSVKISNNVLIRRDEPHSQDRSSSRLFISDSHCLGDIKNDSTKNSKAGCIGFPWRSIPYDDACYGPIIPDTLNLGSKKREVTPRRFRSPLIGHLDLQYYIQDKGGFRGSNLIGCSSDPEEVRLYFNEYKSG